MIGFEESKDAWVRQGALVGDLVAREDAEIIDDLCDVQYQSRRVDPTFEGVYRIDLHLDLILQKLCDPGSKLLVLEVEQDRNLIREEQL